MKLGAKEKTAFSFKYLFVYLWSQEYLYPSKQPMSFIWSLQILDKNCVECSSEFNATLMKSLWQILKELGLFNCPKVWKWCLVLHATERFKELIIYATYFLAWNKTLFKIWGFWESTYSSTEMEITYMNFGICFVALTSQKRESLSLLGIWIFHYPSCAEQINHEWILARTIMIHLFH